MTMRHRRAVGSVARSSRDGTVVMMVVSQAQRARVSDARRNAEDPHQENLDGPAAKVATVAEHGQRLITMAGFPWKQTRFEGPSTY